MGKELTGVWNNMLRELTKMQQRYRWYLALEQITNGSGFLKLSPHLSLKQRATCPRCSERALQYKQALEGKGSLPPLGWRCNAVHGTDAVFVKRVHRSDIRTSMRSSRDVVQSLREREALIKRARGSLELELPQLLPYISLLCAASSLGMDEAGYNIIEQSGFQQLNEIMEGGQPQVCCRVLTLGILRVCTYFLLNCIGALPISAPYYSLNCIYALSIPTTY